MDNNKVNNNNNNCNNSYNNSCDNSCNNNKLFSKVFGNVVIRKNIFKYLRLYNLYSYQLCFFEPEDIRNFKNIKYISYMKSVKFLIKDKNSRLIGVDKYYTFYVDTQINLLHLDNIDTLELVQDIQFIDQKFRILKQLPSSITKLVVNAELLNYTNDNSGINLDIIPSNIKHLKLINFNYNLRKSITVGDSNNSDSYNRTLNSYNMKFSQKLTPIYGLESLVFEGSFDSCLLENSLPKTLTSLVLSDNFSFPITHSILPDSLTLLKLGMSYKYFFKPNMLPKNLKYLELPNYNHILPNNPSVFPSGLIKLLLGNNNFPIKEGCLPSSLESFTLSGSSQTFDSNSFPSGLKELELFEFNGKLDNGSLPTSLKRLCIKSDVRKRNIFSDLFEFNFPDSIEEISVPKLVDIKGLLNIASLKKAQCGYGQVVSSRDSIVSASLRKIKIYEISIIQSSLEHLVNLESLTVDNLYCSLKNDIFPASLKKIKINYCGTSINDLNLPSTLLYLKIKHFLGEIKATKDLFPKSLKYLSANIRGIDNCLPNKLEYLSTLHSNFTSTSVLPKSIKFLHLIVNESTTDECIPIYLPSSSINVLAFSFENCFKFNYEINKESLLSNSSIEDIYIPKSNNQILINKINNKLYKQIKDKLIIINNDNITFKFCKKILNRINKNNN